MQLTVQVRLLTTAAEAAALRATLDLTNQAANTVSEIAWTRRVFRAFDLHRLAYGQIRALGLSAQPAVRVIKKLADADKVDRRTKRSFRADAAQPYDDRCLSWRPDQHTVSIWTVAGRLTAVPFTLGEHQKTLLVHVDRGIVNLATTSGLPRVRDYWRVEPESTAASSANSRRRGQPTYGSSDPSDYPGGSA